MLPARNDFDGLIAVQKPAYEIDIVGQHVEHGGGMRIAFEDRKSLRARVVYARESPDDFPEALVNHLFFGAQETLLEAPAITDSKRPSRRAQRLEYSRRVFAVERNGFLDQHGFPELEGADDRCSMFAFRCRDEDGIHFRPLDDFK